MIADREGGFIRAGKEINRLYHTIDKRKIASALTPSGIEFRFNFSYASNYQGLVERLHRIVNAALETKMIRERPSITEFHTHLCTIEHILNSRPLSTIRTRSTEEFQTVSAFQLFT